MFPVHAGSYCRSVLVSICGFAMTILDFLLEMSLGHELQSAIVIILVAKRRFLSVDLQQVFQLFRLFNLHLVQTLQYAVRRSASD